MAQSVRQRGELVRAFVLGNVEQHASDIVRLTTEKFGITRQAVNKHLNRLVQGGALIEEGNTKARAYRLHPLVEWWGRYDLGDQLDEDRVWREDVVATLEGLPANVLNIWHHGFTEMFNNAIDHSEGKEVGVYVERTALQTRIMILDNGVGIFKKICARFHLEDERHAVLELAKGKLTTDPAHHTGEGIFFTSRMMDRFIIHAGDVFFAHEFGDPKDWILHAEKDANVGTRITMYLDNHTARTAKKVFDEFASDDGDYAFSKTVVPVDLARYGQDQLVSRSQAKRMLARVDRFRTVVLDFKGIEAIGQAFADETFRVFNTEHPVVELVAVNCSDAVQQMITRTGFHRIAPVAPN